MRLVCGVLFFALAASAETPVPDGRAARLEYMRGVAAVLGKEDRDRLEKMAEDLRENRSRFAEGLWLLPRFYEALSTPGAGEIKAHEASETEWLGLLKRLAVWKISKPDSATPRIALAHALVNYAKHGYDSAATPEGEKTNVYNKRLKEAEKVLAEAESLPHASPDFYEAKLRLAYERALESEGFDALFREAVGLEPEYHDFYFIKVNYLIDARRTERGDWVQFAEETAEELGPVLGKEMYARIVWSTDGENPFLNKRVSWPRMKQGLEIMEGRWMHSLWNLSNFCKFACLANDRATAARLFARIGDHFDEMVWDDRASFEKWRNWAGARRQTDRHAGGGESAALRSSAS